MPFKIVRAPPRIFDVNCPICDGARVQFPNAVKEGDTARGCCDHCANWLVVTVTKDGLKVTSPPEETRNKTVMEKCPNCQTSWEIWVRPSKALVKVHGATSLPVANYRCDTCQFEVAYRQ
ncbi:MAG: hypothetical protein ACLP5V_13255 [Candidatus Bathyarchaeia archaeon]